MATAGVLCIGSGGIVVMEAVSEWLAVRASVAPDPGDVASRE